MNKDTCSRCKHWILDNKKGLKYWGRCNRSDRFRLQHMQMEACKKFIDKTPEYIQEWRWKMRKEYPDLQ